MYTHVNIASDDVFSLSPCPAEQAKDMESKAKTAEAAESQEVRGAFDWRWDKAPGTLW